MFQEWTYCLAWADKPHFSDDMNIIQVVRPAVSRYHQLRKCFLTNI